MRYYLILVIALAFCLNSFAQEPVDTAKKSSLIVLPYGYYTTETSYAGGAAADYYFWNKNNLNRVSRVMALVTYSLRNQIVSGLYTNLFLNDSYYIYGKAIYERFPDYFWGVGNDNRSSDSIYYVPNRFYINLEPQKYISEFNRIGVALSYRNEKILGNKYRAGREIDETIAGAKPYQVIGVGGVFMHDSRDNTFYPSGGRYLKNSISAFGGNFHYLEMFSDYRYYKKVWKNHIVANQSVVHAIMGQAPFQLTPTFGGESHLRGYRRGQFRDNLFVMNQTEYRFPLYKRLSGTVFVSVGNVWSDVDQIKLRGLKVAGGVGLRLRVNDAKINIRGDGAVNANGNNGTYLSTGEAF